MGGLRINGRGGAVHNRNNSMLLLILVSLNVTVALIINVRALTAMILPAWLTIGIVSLLFAGVLSVVFRVKYMSLLGWCGITIFLIVGVLSSSPLEEDVHRWARNGDVVPFAASEGFMYTKMIGVIVISLLWIYFYRQLISRGKKNISD